MRNQLASEAARRPCYTHQDRPATFVRIEQRTKPIPSTVRIPQCDECSTSKPRKDDGVKDVRVVKL